MSRTSALKVLDHGMIGPEGTDNCHKFVDILGLRTIFPLFMKTPKKMKKTGTSEKEHEGQWLIRKQQQQMRSLHKGSNQLYPVLACWVVWPIGPSSERCSEICYSTIKEMQSAANSVSKLFVQKDARCLSDNELRLPCIPFPHAWSYAYLKVTGDECDCKTAKNPLINLITLLVLILCSLEF